MHDLALQVTGLCKDYSTITGNLAVLRELSLSVQRGGFVCLLGRSGCGKTTLLNLIAGLDRPDAGEILVAGGGDSQTPTAYMPQQDSLLPWRSALSNAAVGLEVSGVGGKEAQRQARDRFGEFGLEGFEDYWPAQLSAGMQQRVALLRTFLPTREVILLDEPFGRLDAITRGTLQEWLRRLWQATKRTVLAVTHDVEEAILLSEVVYVMSDRPGRVIHRESIDIRRQRAFADIVTSEDFIACKARLLSALGREVAGTR